MVRLLPVVAIAAGLVASYSLSARAADQTVRGKIFKVRDPLPGGDPSPRYVVSSGREVASDNTTVGDPVTNGATLQIIANGATSTEQTFVLPPGPLVSGGAGWKALGTPPVGYYYQDRAGLNGPVKAVIIKKSANGIFTLHAVVVGHLGPGPQPHVTVLPPAPGTDGGIIFTIGGGGDRYCLAFGGAAGGAVSNSPAGSGNKRFRIFNATAEVGCP
jgi:hypothetical protein